MNDNISDSGEAIPDKHSNHTEGDTPPANSDECREHSSRPTTTVVTTTNFEKLVVNTAPDVNKVNADKQESENISTPFLEMLDQIEKRVEVMRKQAQHILDEKECLLQLLNSILESQELRVLTNGDKDDISALIHRLECRCLTVDVAVAVPRNDEQIKCLRRVKMRLEEMRKRVSDLVTGRGGEEGSGEDLDNEVRSCYNACRSDSASGPVDDKFQSLVISCTLEDQKVVREQLASLVRSLSVFLYNRDEDDAS